MKIVENKKVKPRDEALMKGKSRQILDLEEKIKLVQSHISFGLE